MENEDLVGLGDYKLSKKIESIDYLLLEIDNIARRLDFTNYHEIEKRIKEIKKILKNE